MLRRLLSANAMGHSILEHNCGEIAAKPSAGIHIVYAAAWVPMDSGWPAVGTTTRCASGMRARASARVSFRRTPTMSMVWPGAPMAVGWPASAATRPYASGIGPTAPATGSGARTPARSTRPSGAPIVAAGQLRRGPHDTALEGRRWPAAQDVPGHATASPVWPGARMDSISPTAAAAARWAELLLWDAASAEQLHSFAGHTSVVFRVAWVGR